METQRISASGISVSWIPSEAIAGLMRVPLDVGIGQYDPQPPDEIGDIDEFVAAGRCRFANRLDVWADVKDGRIVASGCDGGGLVAKTDVSFGPISLSIPAAGFPEIRATEAAGDHSITYVQTAGGRTGAPFPRRGKSGRSLTLTAPTAWTTVAITINGDGTTSFQPRAASRFPRHWFYGTDGRLAAKSATIDYRDWTSSNHGDHTPWGDAVGSIEIAACESTLERALSVLIMRSQARPNIRTLEPGEALMRCGEAATTMMLVLDGLVEISIDGQFLAQSGPGSVLGERAALETGFRTATVRAATTVKVAEFRPVVLDKTHLDELSRLHRREHDGCPIDERIAALTTASSKDDPPVPVGG